MRIAYCTNVRLPSERAHGHQVAQVCDALVRLGHDVTVFAPFRRNIVREDYWTYYGADPRVKVQHLGSFDPIHSKLLPGLAGLLVLNAMLRKSLADVLRSDQFDLVYTRSPALLPTLLRSGIPVVLELHQLPNRQRKLFVKQCIECRLVSCLTSPMRDALIEWGVPAHKVVVAGDAVDLSRFEKIPTKEKARQALKIQTERIIVGYVGRLKTLGMEKGVLHLLEALKDLSDHHEFFGLIVGGPESDKKEYEELARRLGLGPTDVLFTGEIPGSEVPVALAACDILAMPFPDLPHYRLHMSPLKMFEYMAAHKPIVTSDLPTIRDVLGHETAVLCKPGDVQSLVSSLRWIAEHPQEAQDRADRAFTLVKEHTWEARMKRILHTAFDA
ncbi:MAG TPA: glycosyltransferase family 4 protein [Candidatus Peribacteraceae bacterium]|nr:glycosyltransferase family 4 protein [Candidatus Peribacteraceae bacterium]